MGQAGQTAGAVGAPGKAGEDASAKNGVPGDRPTALGGGPRGRAPAALRAGRKHRSGSPTAKQVSPAPGARTPRVYSRGFGHRIDGAI